MTDQLQLTADVCQLHNMVHTALRDALTALLTLDTTLAQEVREKEKEIDRTSIRLDEACIAWLNEHPSSSEVSRAVASVKIVAELERLGDYANNIAKMVRRRFCCYDMAPFENVLALIRLMMEHALSIVPHRRMQSLSLHQGPLQRRLKLATVAVHPAGDHDIVLGEVIGLGEVNLQGVPLVYWSRRFGGLAVDPA